MKTRSSVLLLVLLVSINCYDFRVHLASLGKDPCPNGLFSDMLTTLKYPFQAYSVTTQDGYILRVFRMQAKNTQITTGKKVVFLQHGLLDSADDWVVNDEDKSLGFVLANAGYDVWLGNSRGNKYSRANMNISPSHRAFWDYSFQEMGLYDVKAQLSFVINFTGAKKITYVGHSQGTTQMFAALSDPSTQAFVNTYINVFIALAPVVYVANATSKLVKYLAGDSVLIDACKLFGIDEWLPGACSKTSAQSEFEHYCCLLDPLLCDAFISLVADYDPRYDNEKRFPIFVEHNPSGSSMHSLLHYRQLYEESKLKQVFRRFDYGRTENEKKYGQATPPPYDLTLINLPIRGFTGLDDELGDPTDSAMLAADLQRLGKDYKSYTYNNCGHLTFMWAKDPAQMFKDILGEIANFA